LIFLPRQWNPSDELFTTRVNDLIRTRGIDYVANLTGRTNQTVRRWSRGGQASNRAMRESVARAGLRTRQGERQSPSTQVIQSRVGGRFSTEGQIISSGISRRYRMRVRQAEAQRSAAIESARTPRQREMAEAQTQRELAGTRQEWADLDAQYRALESRDLDAINEAFGTEYDYDPYWWEMDWYDDLWEDFRNAYNEQ
jgi:hypothetical protein